MTLLAYTLMKCVARKILIKIEIKFKRDYFRDIAFKQDIRIQIFIDKNICFVFFVLFLMTHKNIIFYTQNSRGKFFSIQ